MCESGGPNPPSHYQFDVLHKIVFLQVFALDSCTVNYRYNVTDGTLKKLRYIRFYVLPV